ncbi:alpha/beta fold hydrolase [Frigidibacter sp. ROC022]|uniref:alpha/beta fold hydrolase n=1 Tax=Frigidibacter sp. ROC022 TaxID=2971796 RepID=UPI00215AB335|nr:alpha/beta fold hydrolase [Frigidibacter sp. ROC022]MCR8723002.1 alpha/beta fold hydrolase [Frigidibacter sp. ROC022]
MLARTIHGTPTDRPTLLIAHGLFGSGRNWGVIARRLADSRQVVTVDMRNHAASPRDERHDYPALAEDLAETIADLGAPCDMLGHSMGGKAAMVCAVTRSELLRRLIVADIAPVGYAHTQMHLIEAMRAVGSDFASRAEADAALAPLVEEPSVRSFLLQSLDMKEKRWTLNLDALAGNMDNILGFPPLTGSFPGPALFLTGAESSYVLPEHRGEIRRLFPAARFAKIPGAGHWLHAEKPRETEAAIRVFLDA